MGAIRTGVYQYFFARYPDDEAQVTSLLHWFDVTHAERLDGGLSAYYLKATDASVARFLGTDDNREILYIYSPHARIEARDIESCSTELAKNSLRLDPRLCLLGCGDPATGARIKSVLLEDPERSPLVGLSRSELSGIQSPDDLYRLFKERHFVRDYFSLEAPLNEDAMFFGRDQLVSELAERIGVGQNSGLFGLRRIGKTSVLYAVARRCRAAGLGYAYYRDLSPAYNLRWWQLLELLVKEITHDLGLGKSAKRKVTAITDGYQEYDASISFGNDIQFLAARAPHGRLVLLLDEIEYVTFDLSPVDHWRDDFLSFWTTMRSVHQNSHAKFTYLIAGVNPYALEAHRIGNHDNPLFSTTKPFFLAPLDSNQSAEMVRSLGRMMGLSSERQFLDGLFERFAGHPFLTRQACSYLARLLPDRPAVLRSDDLASHEQEIYRALRPNARQILTVLETWYPFEYELLEALADGKTEEFLEYAQSSPEFASHVVGYGLVSDPDTDPNMTMNLIGHELRQRSRTTALTEIARDRLDVSSKAPTKQDSEEWAEIIAEVSRRRNRIERELRTRAAFALELTFGKQKTSQVLKSVGGGRRATLENLAYHEMWADMYLNELRQVLIDNWPVFENWAPGSKESFDATLATINQGRVDAHAGELDAEALSYLRVCFSKLEAACELT